MLRIIAALSLATMLTASAIPAVAQGELAGEQSFGADEGGTPSFLEALAGLFSVEALEDLLRGFGKDTASEDVASEEAADEDAFVETFCGVFGGLFDDFCKDVTGENGSDGGGVSDRTVPLAVQGFEQEAESGDVSMSLETSNAGDNSNVCAPALQFGNSGNLQNAQGITQHGSEADDVGFEGSQFVFAPEVATRCDQAVQQSSTASGGRGR